MTGKNLKAIIDGVQYPEVEFINTVQLIVNDLKDEAIDKFYGDVSKEDLTPEDEKALKYIYKFDFNDFLLKEGAWNTYIFRQKASDISRYSYESALSNEDYEKAIQIWYSAFNELIREKRRVIKEVIASRLNSLKSGNERHKNMLKWFFTRLREAMNSVTRSMQDDYEDIIKAAKELKRKQADQEGKEKTAKEKNVKDNIDRETEAKDTKASDKGKANDKNIDGDEDGAESMRERKMPPFGAIGSLRERIMKGIANPTKPSAEKQDKQGENIEEEEEDGMMFSPFARRRMTPPIRRAVRGRAIGGSEDMNKDIDEDKNMDMDKAMGKDTDKKSGTADKQQNSILVEDVLVISDKELKKHISDPHVEAVVNSLRENKMVSAGLVQKMLDIIKPNREDKLPMKIAILNYLLIKNRPILPFMPTVYNAIELKEGGDKEPKKKLN